LADCGVSLQTGKCGNIQLFNKHHGIFFVSGQVV